MAAPSSYTEQTLAEYMHGVLGNDEMARALSWSVAEGDYGDAVDETLLAYGVDDISEISGRNNIRKLRTLARRELWRLVMQRTAGMHDTTAGVEAGGEEFSQIHAHARKMYDIADGEAQPYDSAVDYAMGKTAVRYTGDHYRHTDDESNEWSRVDS